MSTTTPSATPVLDPTGPHAPAALAAARHRAMANHPAGTARPAGHTAEMRRTPGAAPAEGASVEVTDAGGLRPDLRHGADRVAGAGSRDEVTGDDPVRDEAVWPKGQVNDRVARLAGEAGSVIAEYGLVLIVGALVAGVAMRWVGGGAIFELFDAIIAKVRTVAQL